MQGYLARAAAPPLGAPRTRHRSRRRSVASPTRTRSYWRGARTYRRGFRSSAGSSPPVAPSTLPAAGGAAPPSLRSAPDRTVRREQIAPGLRCVWRGTARRPCQRTSTRPARGGRFATAVQLLSYPCDVFLARPAGLVKASRAGVRSLCSEVSLNLFHTCTGDIPGEFGKEGLVGAVRSARYQRIRNRSVDARQLLQRRGIGLVHVDRHVHILLVRSHLLGADILADLLAELLNADVLAVLEELAHHAIAEIGDGAQQLVRRHLVQVELGGGGCGRGRCVWLCRPGRLGGGRCGGGCGDGG